MITQLFGILDFIAGTTLFLLHFFPSSPTLSLIAFIFAFYLIVKAAVFFNFFTSTLDILSAIFLFLATIPFYPSFNWIFVLWLLQKAFFSILT